MRRQEEIWDATKGNATFVEMTKQLKKDVSAPALDFGELRSNITTFCALLFTLFGEGCNLYKSIAEFLQILSHQFSMQNKYGNEMQNWSKGGRKEKTRLHSQRTILGEINLS